MRNEHLILSILAEDRPGIVSAVADCVKRCGGNWLESTLSTLGGHFAGIVHIAIEASKKDLLESSFLELNRSGISVQIAKAIDVAPEPAGASAHTTVISLEANDREGIVEEITAALANIGVNVRKITTRCESAAMAGYDLFFAELLVTLPESASTGDLESALQSLSDDIMVSIGE